MGIVNSQSRCNIRRTMVLERLRRALGKAKEGQTTRKAKQPLKPYLESQIAILEKRVQPIVTGQRKAV